MKNYYPNPPAIGAVYPPHNHPVYDPNFVPRPISLPGPWPKTCSLATKEVRFLLTKISSVMTELNRAAISGTVTELVGSNLATSVVAIKVIEEALDLLKQDLKEAYAKAVQIEGD